MEDDLLLCRPILDGLPSYELGDEAYAANEAERTWAQQLLGTLGQCLTWLQPMLTPDNHDSLVACILDKVGSPSQPLFNISLFMTLLQGSLTREKLICSCL